MACFNGETGINETLVALRVVVNQNCAFVHDERVYLQIDSKQGISGVFATCQHFLHIKNIHEGTFICI